MSSISDSRWNGKKEATAGRPSIHDESDKEDSNDATGTGEKCAAVALK